MDAHVVSTSVEHQFFVGKCPRYHRLYLKRMEKKHQSLPAQWSQVWLEFFEIHVSIPAAPPCICLIKRERKTNKK